MITKNNPEDKKKQIQMVSIDELVPQDHLLRKIDKYIDFDFIYDLVEDRYSTETGRPSIDPVTLIKIPIIQYMYGIKSMRQTIKTNISKKPSGRYASSPTACLSPKKGCSATAGWKACRSIRLITGDVPTDGLSLHYARCWMCYHNNSAAEPKYWNS